MKKANYLDPISGHIKKLLAVIKSKKKRDQHNSKTNHKLKTNPLILKRKVESELISKLYKMDTLELEKIEDPSYGNAKGSDYSLFQDNSPEIKKVAEDLKKLITKSINSDIYIDDSFYTILSSGGGVKRHRHISSIDEKLCKDLEIIKYSLVYYLKTGNQESTQPGILKLYNPNQNFLPNEGMIIIFSADREHSAFYSGNEDRIMIGINFYCI